MRLGDDINGYFSPYNTTPRMKLHPILKNILSLFAGLIAGSAVNYLLLKIGTYVVPPPGGADVLSEEGFKAAFPLFEPRHFIFPFLSHALGTFAGAYVACRISGGLLRPALIISAAFLVGGVTMVLDYGGPLPFIIVDLALAYIPMGLLAYRLAPKKS
jgi:hypothetical protein